MSTYKDHGATLPAYDNAFWADGIPNRPVAGRPRWSKDEPPPKVGTIIVVTMNGIGKALVTGYFEEDGWLGLRCRLLEPPERLRKQKEFDEYGGHIFGPEYKEVSDGDE